MLDIMSQAKNAIEAYNTALKATSSNIANMNVSGYKRIEVSFQSVYEKVLRQGSAAQGNLGGTNPQQVGQGVSLSAVGIDFSSGEYSDASSLDLAISGQGLFIVSANDGNSYLYTRSGSFEVDSNGNLTSNGMQVYGLNASNSLVPITGLPSGDKSDFQWQSDGSLEYSADGGTTWVSTGYRIALTYFPNPNGLNQAQGTAFAETVASGESATAQAPGGAVGSVNPGKLEQSNVDYLSETIDALEFQRAMSGNLTMLRLASDTISSFISRLS
ncbi:MAG: flagellar hook basal-body protein [Candidatus Saganbacteria bacterium]|nr:flagellar hook basal-body protein [Candidatus Saganbacteria bacterium]